MATNIKERVMRGSFWSLVGSSSNQVLGFIVFIILSRQLTPVEFGIMAMALIFIELLLPVVRIGMEGQLIKEKELSQVTKSTAFWTSLIAALVVIGVLMAGSGYITRLFGVDSLKHVIQILAVLPLFAALNIVHNALLRREYQFKAIAIRQMIVSSIGGIIAIIMALKGYGVYSLVFQRMGSAVITCILLWIMVKWRPTLTFSWDDAKRFIAMGIPIMGSSLLVTANYRVKDFIIGVFLGPASLGYLRIAYKLHDVIVQFAVSPIENIALPTFSKSQQDWRKLRKTYLRLVQLCGLVTVPSFFGMMVIAPEFITFVFGEKWAISAELMQILCVASISTSLNYFYKPLMIAVGKPRLVIQVSTIEFLLLLVIITTAAQFNLMMVMVGHVLWVTILTFVILRIIQREIGISPQDVWKNFMPPVVMSVIMCLLLFVEKYFLAGQVGSILMTAIVVATGVVVYVGGMVVVFPDYTRTTKEAVLPTLKAVLQR